MYRENSGNEHLPAAAYRTFGQPYVVCDLKPRQEYTSRLTAEVKACQDLFHGQVVHDKIHARYNDSYYQWLEAVYYGTAKGEASPKSRLSYLVSHYFYLQLRMRPPARRSADTLIPWSTSI